MFNFIGTRKPNFSNLSSDVYGDYWQNKGFKLRGKLMEREKIFFHWIQPKSTVLSIGCGNSRLLWELREQKDCAVFGVDIATSVINGLKNNNIEAYQADITKQDFNIKALFNQQFDYIIISEVLEHLVMPEELLNNIRHDAKYIMVSIPNSAFYRYRLGLLINGRFFTQWAKHPAEHLRFWSHIDFCDWLEALGFKIVYTKASNGLSIGGFNLFNKNLNLFGHQICYLLMDKNRS